MGLVGVGFTVPAAVPVPLPLPGFERPGFAEDVS
jgi:hypothetical protein